MRKSTMGPAAIMEWILATSGWQGESLIGHFSRQLYQTLHKVPLFAEWRRDLSLEYCGRENR